MNKKELVAAVAERCGVKKNETEKVLDAFAEAVKDALKSGDKVAMVGFGTFEVAEREERLGRNPKNGETLIIPASKCPKFKPGKAFKDEVNA